MCSSIHQVKMQCVSACVELIDFEDCSCCAFEVFSQDWEWSKCNMQYDILTESVKDRLVRH